MFSDTWHFYLKYYCILGLTKSPKGFIFISYYNLISHKMFKLFYKFVVEIHVSNIDLNVPISIKKNCVRLNCPKWKEIGQRLEERHLLEQKNCNFPFFALLTSKVVYYNYVFNLVKNFKIIPDLILGSL